MKRVGTALLCAALTACALAGCAPSPAAQTTEPPSTPGLASAPASPTPTDPEPDEAPYDESDYYFDFGQDDRIRLDYDVDWPREAMAGWSETESTRVSALLTLEKEGDSLTVLLEDAPECPDLAAFVETARQLLTYNYEGVDLDAGAQAGEYFLVSGALADGGIVLSAYRQVDGLYLTVEMRAGAQTAEAAREALLETFLPGLAIQNNMEE